MGCCVSSPEDGGQARSAKTKKGRNTKPSPLSVPEAIWETNTSWAGSNEMLREKAAETGEEAAFRAAFQPTMFKRVRDWIEGEYPECARAGTIEDLGDLVFPTSYGPCRYPTNAILTLDDNFTGVIYDATLIVAMPMGEQVNDKVSALPGAGLDTPEMEGAKLTMLKMLAKMRQDDVNVDHAVVRVVTGADMVTCKFDASTTEPTITKLSSNPSSTFKSSNQEMVRAARRAPDEVRGRFRPFMFKGTVHNCIPGCTVWDEGELRFSVKGNVYPYPTRILVERDFKKMSEDVEAVHSKVLSPGDGPNDKPVMLLRNLNPHRDPRGIVSITLVVASAPDVLWPACGAYVKSAAFKAAENAILEFVKKLNSEGKVQRCKVNVAMGVDRSRFKFVGEKVVTSSIEHQEIKRAAPTAATDKPVAEISPEKKKNECGLEAFSITLEEQKEHKLFDSESHFQAIKQHVRERAQQNPDLYQNLAPRLSLLAAMHIMEMNFPGCEVSDEGEFPVIMNGNDIELADTRLVVVRDPKQEPKSIIAATHVVPRPGTLAQETNWLETKEMKAAEDALLALLKKWHEEGKVSELDCMAQVMMGTDASIYQFVDGERLVDYSDERMAQFKWG
ncbi:hypothetical protein BJ170DRAFT_678409 [Xylariales sp. AK1849]|nr:hypothetical protein BJ170DRAFT_678409 [Xylariales sp. AK1849]